jgi:ectoine hydroxylase-related dioxygenase (phytanoyl-CoA dioxygenase family)
MLVDLRCDAELTYFDVPRMRSSTSNDYLTTGIAFAFHPHRDTWYSAPQCQLNWWLPIFPIAEDNGLAFHPKYHHNPVQNSSRVYNYAEWNATSRKIAASQIGVDTRIQPKPEEEVELHPQIRPIAVPGGIILFSGAQLHSSVPNTSGRTRLSIDLRTVHLGDVAERRGARNVDSQCSGTTMGDYLRVSDLALTGSSPTAA